MSIMRLSESARPSTQQEAEFLELLAITEGWLHALTSYDSHTTM